MDNVDGKGKILIVDDMISTISVLRFSLQNEGYYVFVALNGEKAIKSAEEIAPDLILLDIHMPGMDGFLTCRRLKTNLKTQDIPIIFMTALTDASSTITGFESGGVDYVTKPIETEEVLARIKTHITLRNIQKQLETQNEKLKIEIADRKRAEEQLSQLNTELDKRVEARTIELSQTNIQLTKEIEERKQVEERLLKYQKQLQSLTSEISLTEEREQRRIAGELHDSIGQTLSLCKIKLAELHNSISDSEQSDSLEQIQELINSTIKETRSLILELYHPVLYQLGLKAAIEWLGSHFSEKYGINIQCKCSKLERSFKEELSFFLFKAVREILLNVIKHARATEVVCSSKIVKNRLKIIIQDNGIGFDVSGLHSAETEGFGLFNIRERISYLGGSIAISSKPEHGTEVTIEVPYN